MFGNPTAYSSRAAVRSAPSLAQLSAAAVPLGSGGRGRRRGVPGPLQPPAAFVRRGRRCRPAPRRVQRGRHKLAAETSALPGGRGGRGAPLVVPPPPRSPQPAAGGGSRPCAADNVSRMGNGGGGAAPPAPACYTGGPGPPPPVPPPPAGVPAPLPSTRRLLPLTLTFRDGLRWALPPLAACTPSRRQGDAGGEAEPPSAGGRGPAAPCPGAAAGGRAASRGQAGPAPPGAGCGQVVPRGRAPGPLPRRLCLSRRLRCAAASSHMEPPPLAAPLAAAGREEASSSGRGPRPALPLMHCGRPGPRLQRRGGGRGNR